MLFTDVYNNVTCNNIFGPYWQCIELVANVYRKVFKCTSHQWESMKQLQWFCERLDFKRVVDKRKLLFWRG